MEPAALLLLCVLIFVAATIYTSVGHAGASGYLAAMALVGVPPVVMKPTALTLNILVATLATFRLQRAGLVNWRALLPLLAGSVPLAFIGGAIQLPGRAYRILIGLVLLAAAAKLLFQPRQTPGRGTAAAPERIPLLPALATGMLVGALSGLTGTGGGIFLSPLLLFFGWAGARQATGLTAPFILMNSMAGLAGNVMSLRSLPAEMPWFMVAAVLGTAVGTQLGIRWFSIVALQRMLAVVVLVAGGKFLLT
jgi:uncharacterized membrane protein YfcA